jgi:hypothetical protein
VDGDRLEICQYQPSQKLPRTKDDDEEDGDLFLAGSSSTKTSRSPHKTPDRSQD